MTDTGVVDPVRVPDWLRNGVLEAWRETPAMARLFIGLAIVDVVSRGLGILQPRYDIGGDLFGAYLMLVPHDLWILLPAVLLFRRPDAARATPLVFWGAVTVALATTLERPVEHLLEGPFGPTVVSLEISVLASIAFVVGWVLIARGLVPLNPARPAPTAAGFANLVVGLGLVGIVVALVRYVATGVGVGIPALDGVVTLLNLVAAARSAAWLYLLWIVIRGLGDSRRSSLAITVGVVGAALSGLFDPIASVLGALVTGLGSPSLVGAGAGLQSVVYALTLVSLGVGQALVAVAFGLGLAEPPLPYAAPSGPTAAEPAEPAEPHDPASEADALPT